MIPGSLMFEGFSLHIVSKISENVCCVICSNILNNPHQAPCGCRFCFDCIKSYLENNKTKCPGQTEDCFEQNLNIDTDLQPDILAKREIGKMFVKCPLYLCDKKYELRKMKDHLTECATTVILCGKCNRSITRGEYKNHEVNECEESIVICDFCNIGMIRRILKEEHHNYDHESICIFYTNYCPNECGERNKVVWAKHRRICLTTHLECPYRTVGCNSESLKVKEMTSHMTENVYNHTEKLLKEINNLNNENETLKNTLINVNNEMRLLKKKCDQLEDVIIQMNEQMEDLKETDNRKINHLRDNLKEEINFSSNAQSSINHKMTKEMENIKNEVVALKETYNILHSKQITNSKSVHPADLKLNDIEGARNLRSEDIVLVWKINNFFDINILNSPIFYTHNRGYKMDLHLEKKVRGYLSLYARLRCGPYDESLEWPFRRSLTVRIVNQNICGKEFGKTILFDEKAGSVCDRKYLSDTGDFGFAKFITYKELYDNSYTIKKDRLIIHCFVDTII